MRLAARLAERSLGGKVHFANSGTEAVEAALKVARKAHPGGDVISVQRAFHGRTYGSLSATPQESKQALFALLVPGFRAVEATAEAITEAPWALGPRPCCSSPCRARAACTCWAMTCPGRRARPATSTARR